MKMKRSSLPNIVASCVLLLWSSGEFAQKDPGVRGGLANTGGGRRFYALGLLYRRNS